MFTILSVEASVALGASDSIAFVSRIAVAGSGVLGAARGADTHRLAVRVARLALQTHESIAVVVFEALASSGVLGAPCGAGGHRLGVRVARLTFRTHESIAVVAFEACASSGVLSAARGASVARDGVIVANLAGDTVDSILAVEARVTLCASESVASVAFRARAGYSIGRGTYGAGVGRHSRQAARSTGDAA